MRRAPVSEAQGTGPHSRKWTGYWVCGKGVEGSVTQGAEGGPGTQHKV